MTKTFPLITALLLLSLVMVGTAVAQAAPAPELNERFLRTTGIDPGKIVQHYYLVKNGGVIEFSAKESGDTATAAAIMKYFEAQRLMFEKGKNESETDIHGKVPEGALTIRRLRNEITFFSAKNETGTGGVLRMFSVNPEAKKAIQDFLKFQIAEHQTGDSPTEDQ